MAKSKSLNKQLSRRDPSDEEFISVLDEFHQGSDRVAAIMGAALVDNALIGAIRASLNDPNDEGALFYDQSAPFGNFHARIISGKALGLFDLSTENDLHIIKNIRNQFAHALLKLDFSNIHISDSCKKIRYYSHSDIPVREISEVRLKYEAACYCISLNITISTNKLLKSKSSRLRKPMTLRDFMSSSFQNGSENVPDKVLPDKIGVKE